MKLKIGQIIHILGNPMFKLEFITKRFLSRASYRRSGVYLDEQKRPMETHNIPDENAPEAVVYTDIFCL